MEIKKLNYNLKKCNDLEKRYQSQLYKLGDEICEKKIANAYLGNSNKNNNSRQSKTPERNGDVTKENLSAERKSLTAAQSISRLSLAPAGNLYPSN